MITWKTVVIDVPKIRQWITITQISKNVNKHYANYKCSSSRLNLHFFKKPNNDKHQPTKIIRGLELQKHISDKMLTKSASGVSHIWIK